VRRTTKVDAPKVLHPKRYQAPHHLRHVFASPVVSAAVNMLALQRMPYADLFDDDLDAVAVTLDSRYSREGVGKMWANRAQKHGRKGEMASHCASRRRTLAAAEEFEPYPVAMVGGR
jgi:hypothetical protein